MAERKRTNIDPQNTTQKTKDWAKQTPLKSGGNSRKVRRVWRYQRGNQKPYIEEEQTTQWPKEKVQKDQQHTYKSKDRVRSDLPYM